MASFGFMIRATAQGLLPGTSRGFRITCRLGNRSLYLELSNWNGVGTMGAGVTGAVCAHIEAQPEAIKTTPQSSRVKCMRISLSGLYLRNYA